MWEMGVGEIIVGADDDDDDADDLEIISRTFLGS
jgi:hypothetical protein